MDEENASALEESSNSETEDYLEVDDVQSDAQGEVSDQENISSIDLHDNVPEPETPLVPSEEDSSILTLFQKNKQSRTRHVWTTSKDTSRRAAEINVVPVTRGPIRTLRDIVDPMLLFEHFITNEIQDEIVKWTNAEMATKRQNYVQNTSTQNDTTKEEIKALIGILVLAAALKDNHLSLDELFNTEYSGSRYVSCMSKQRCNFLLRCLRFDDKTFRLQRQNDDPFTPIRDLWEMLMVQCRQNYIPGTNVTIDEQLLAFRGKCKFRMCIPNKPAKYGVKMEMLCDSGTRYMIDGAPYLGKGTNTGRVPLGEHFVKELTRSIHGTNRNVTMDNWFTSVPLAKQLLQQPYKLTLVGSLRANTKEIPEEMKNNRSRDVNTSMFCYDGPLTLLSYKPKPSKMVYLLSSCDENGSVDPQTKKPHIIDFYNKTKGGVDTFDKMCSVISCSRKTNRWPLCVFYGMLNISCINSYIICCHNTCVMGQSVMTRRDFMKKLHMQLVEPWLKIRLGIHTMPRHVKDNIANVLGVSTVGGQGKGQTSSSNNDLQPVEVTNRKRKTCGLCSYKKRRMTKSYCSKCNIAICGEHKVDFCVQCALK